MGEAQKTQSWLRCGAHRLDLSRPCIMGILNLTPDSFSDGGRWLDPERALDRALQMVEEGAAIIDIGGESTRPGAPSVPLEEELRRVIPLLEQLAHRLPVPISVDTSKAAVMQAAADAGAGMINDVCALQGPEALSTAARIQLPVCLMHMQGEPRTMQAQPQYDDVVAEVASFLQQRLEACCAAGVSAQALLFDPGFGFGKTLTHNLSLLRELPQLAALGQPVLVGLSRKSMLGQLTGRGVDQRMPASVTAALLAVQRGAWMVRVHDVAATHDALALWQAVSSVSVRA